MTLPTTTRRLHADCHSRFGSLAATVTALAALALPGAAAGAEPNTTPKADSATPSQPSRTECLEAHRDAQQLKHDNHLIEAWEKLEICSSATCPGAVIGDCGQWIAQLEQITPSMVFEVRIDGQPATDAQLFVDGQPVVDSTRALKVNPGRHLVRVELPPFAPREEPVVLAEGQRMRLVAIEFKSEKPVAAEAPPREQPAPAPRATERPTPVLVYPLLGVGVAGLATFGVFSFMGHSKQNDLEDQCQPNCTESQVAPMKRDYLIADVSAGVGAAALLTAGVLYLVRPTREVEAAAGLSLDAPQIGLGRGGVGWVTISATKTW